MKTLEELGISPAPWAAGEDEVTANAWDSSHGMSYDALVADCRNDADAALVSAAPEMYEALQEMVRCACCDCKRYDECHQYTEDGIWSECNMMHMARAALAKVTGEEARK